MPHLSPMNWLLAILTFWLVLMLFTSNIWWTNMHTFETDTQNKQVGPELPWSWTLQGGWD